MFVLIGLFALALAAGVLGGIVGTGTSLVLLPVLVLLYGPRVAVPIMAIASFMGNGGRVIAWWGQIRWRPVVAYSLPGIPAAVLGAHTLLTVPPAAIEVCLAVFFVGIIPLRRWAARRDLRLGTKQMIVAGAVIGFLTGLIFSTGPLSVPVFTGYGLTGGAFLGSEAASALLLYLGKLATFGGAGALTASVAARGGVIGAALMAGSFLSRRVVRRVQPHQFAVLIDLVLVVAAAGMVVSAV